MKRAWVTYLTVGGLAVLLGLLAVFQYRWLTQISASDGEKTRNRLKEDTDRFASDFNREIQNVYFNFQTDAAPWKSKNWTPFIERYDFWHKKANYPDLISDVYFFEAKGDAQ